MVLTQKKGKKGMSAEYRLILLADMSTNTLFHIDQHRPARMLEHLADTSPTLGRHLFDTSLTLSNTKLI